ncbi:hypothetical protein DET49_11522 [Salegentibacter sp. 24]|uniref:sulfite exporter TauE/SafE family protein n=1 Tax=Salegentibacter sp. 24 TaxID=2183986 RepID=UPI00105B87AD|nr:sulfite exporter TauE/SafE family protein [Salegentibacter sp. 24]TDN86362.1 hypothetical protein DET49_11522 [Salegentibacter sp. 24]
MLYPELNIVFLFILVMVSFMYAVVGHGGASGYLALMAICAFPVSFMKPTALVLNVVVSAVAFLFFRKGNFNRRLFLWLVLGSIPAAFLGGYLSIPAQYFKLILGGFLLIGALRISGFFGKEKSRIVQPKLLIVIIAGMIIGLLSGMIGIGGGIILSPLIVILGWGTMKEAAAISALFILVNSLAGLTGFFVQGGFIPAESFWLLPAVLLGGSLGAYFGSQRISALSLRYILSGVLALACLKLVIL